MVRLVPARNLIDIPVHPAADLFPMIADSDEPAMVSLINSIKANGQLHPIIMWNGVIVDGRNRYAACKQAGIVPKTKSMTFESDADAIRYIISTNIHRRHLTDEQRDQIGARLVTMQQGDNQWSQQNAGGKVGVADAAAMVHSTPARIERARTIERADPEMAEKVIRGEISKGKALKEIRERAKPKPDPDRADDKVQDADDEANANGNTAATADCYKKFIKLSATEKTAFIELIREYIP